MSVYIGKCKKCKHGLRVDYRDVQDLTAEQYRQREFDLSGGFMIQGVQPFGYCEEHGAFKLNFLQGRLVPDHKCDARCTGAHGPKCDCSCGGANHGMALAA